MASINPSAMLAESLSTFSKAAYQAFAEVENQSRLEVARVATDIREAKLERDKAFKELHTCLLEAQSWKQEIVSAKAALSQTELTIAHQAETLAVQAETIAQLRREVTQWKDQSRNWQEHFLRVEQERCAQSSRIDELVVEKLQYPHQRTSSTSLFTPKSSKYTNGVNSAPSSTSKRTADSSPTQPPAYKPAALPSPSEQDTITVKPSVQTSANAQKRTKATVKPPKQAAQQEQVVPSPQAFGDLEEGTSTSTKRPRKSHTTSQQQNAPKPELPVTVRSSTVIRRVQAIVHVKREEDSADESQETVPQPSSSLSGVMKKKEESVDPQRYLRTPRRVMSEGEEEDEISAELSSDSLSEEGSQESVKRPRFRQRGRINYAEDDDEEEEDELMMGAEENHDEVYGTQRVEMNDNQRSKKQIAAGPPPKKRKTGAR